MGDVFEFRWDRPKLAITAVAFVAIAGLGVVFLMQPGRDVQALGLVWLAVFLSGAATLIRLRSDRRPIVRVSAAGLWDRRIKDDVIPWPAIACVGSLEAEQITFVGLDFHDARAVLADAKWLVRVMAPLQRLLRFPCVSINMTLLDGSDHDLFAAIARFAPALIGHNN